MLEYHGKHDRVQELREARKLIPTDMMSRMSTVADYANMKRRNHPDMDKYRAAQSEKRGDTTKFTVKMVNKYDKF